MVTRGFSSLFPNMHLLIHVHKDGQQRRKKEGRKQMFPRRFEPAAATQLANTINGTHTQMRNTVLTTRAQGPHPVTNPKCDKG